MTKLGQILISREKITQEQLQEVLIIQRKTKERIGKILVDLGYINEEDLLSAFAELKGVEFVRLSNLPEIPRELLDLIPFDYAFKKSVVPLSISNDKTTIYVATGTLNEVVLDDLKHIAGNKKIVAKLTLESDIKKFFDTHFSKSFQEVLTGMSSRQTEIKNIEEEVNADVEIVKEEEMRVSGEEQAPAIRIVNEVLKRAVDIRASDIHIEPYGEGVYLRYRIDGVLHEQPSLPKKLQNSIISRIKIMAKLDIAERRLPQDGRIKIKLGEKEIDLRISILPTVFGGKAVIRILDPGSLCVDLSKLGIEPTALELYQRKIKTPHGIILVTGPTGSGKTTTLYSTLTTLNSRDVNIITVEDPVEYILKGINQMQAFPEIGLTFANSLRSFLRQDPDIIMVGEIRDTETAEIAINAALTGHLVFSTLHTNDAVGTITRLINMGIEPFLISTTLILSLAQRLVRRLCPDCRQPYEYPMEKLAKLGVDAPMLANVKRTAHSVTLYTNKGCDNCMRTGYKGRVGCYEILDVKEDIKELILQRSSAREIKDAALKNNDMITIRKDALTKLLAGTTTLDEVLRISTND
ncbi:MAG: ATPase, T2SS/T4P/T4SS family [Elusimicrobia bacterium]|nr:ATPase, T2SS/T4P/T4SS family [Elusimicrobiota bacterium]